MNSRQRQPRPRGIGHAMLFLLAAFPAVALATVTSEDPVGEKTPVQVSIQPAPPTRFKLERLVSANGKVMSLNPQPLPPIPDDPIPHEGAMIEVPIVVRPPDLLLVEVLEALPGRPISGERLVRPDGTISLGFYGDIHVSGLTLVQVKVKLIEHLRQFLPDEVLGLIITPLTEAAEPSSDPPQSEVPPLPDSERDPFDLDVKPKPSAFRPTRPRASHLPVRRASAQEPVTPTRDERTRSTKTVVTPGGRMKITIEMDNEIRRDRPKELPTPDQKVAASASRSLSVAVPPEETERVLVDLTAYNSMFYFVLGDVARPGRMPITGRETVLDAITFGGGLIPSADPKGVRLFRPGHDGKPAKSLSVDLDAINHGDSLTNYQVFPGDRIYVDRNPIVAAGLDSDRLAGVVQNFTQALTQSQSLHRTLATARPDLTPDARARLASEWFDRWWEATQKTRLSADERTTFRELFLEGFRPTANPEPGKK